MFTVNETTALPTVSIIDDDDAVRASLAVLLKSCDYRVQCFASAEEFLQHEGQATTDLLIVDVRLPKLSGLELLEHLADAGISPPAIVITGHAEVDASRLDFWLNGITVLPKPCDPKTLLSRVAELLDSE